MARKRVGLPATSAGEKIFSISGLAEDLSLAEINDLVKEQVTNWQKNPGHPERDNYKLHVLGGDENTLAYFVLEHKDEGYRQAVADVWDLDIEVVREDDHLRVTCTL